MPGSQEEKRQRNAMKSNYFGAFVKAICTERQLVAECEV
jgi:hypothetical protein